MTGLKGGLLPRSTSRSNMRNVTAAKVASDGAPSVVAEEVATAKIPVVSYFRVSTVGQGEEDKSGLDRQEEETSVRWFQTYGDRYELIENVTDRGISGAKKGRFDWFVDGLEKGFYGLGTVLLVERVSRFGRMKASDTIAQLHEIWNAGGVTAFCDLGSGRPFGKDGLDDESGLIFELIGAVRQSRREWEEKQARSKGAVFKQRKLIREHADGQSCWFGEFRFKPRTKATAEPGYPFWLNAGSDGKWEKLEDKVNWIHEVFELNIAGRGAPTIARLLREKGIKTHRGGDLTSAHVGQILNNRALLGERWTNTGRTNIDGTDEMDVIKAVYPTVISPEMFQQAQDVRKATGFGRQNPSGSKMQNLFEKRCHCMDCGGRIGVRNGRNNTKAMFCRNKQEKGCSTPNVPYDEGAMLDRLSAFRWEDFFGTPSTMQSVQQLPLRLNGGSLKSLQSRA